MLPVIFGRLLTLPTLLLLPACAFLNDADRKHALDHDGDGLIAAALGGSDCDDEESAVGGPTAWFMDADADGVGAGTPELACSAPPGTVATGDDCDDADTTVTTGSVATWFADTDGDRRGDPTAAVDACRAPAAHVRDSTDCDDGNATVFPGATETCDGVDNDCDGVESPCELGANGALLHDGASAASGSFGFALATMDVGLRKQRIVVGRPIGGAGSVWYGSLGSPDAQGQYEPDDVGAVVYQGDIPGDGFGTRVVSADFYDADGADDFLASAPGVAVDDVLNSGAIYVYDGQHIGVPVITLTWGASAGKFGSALVSRVTDGTSWFVAGMPGAQGGRGAAVLAYGFTEDTDLSDPPPEIGMATWIAEGADEAEHGALGTAVAAGDFNADGLSDDAIGAPGYRDGAGRIYVTIAPLSTSMDLSTATPIVLDGETADQAGGVLFVGDLTGDGYDDLVVGEPDSTREGARGGAVYILSGPSLASGAVSTDAATIVGAVGTRTGASLTIGDYGDGAQLAIGGPAWTNARGDLDAGAVIVMPSGLSLGASYALPADARDVYTCPNPDCQAGVALATGDFDGDEGSDIAFGAPGLATAGQTDGAVGFLFGGAL